MNQDELIKQISATIGKRKVLELSRILNKQNFALRDLIALTFCPNKDIAFRAAWILENIFLQRPETYLPDVEYLITVMPNVKYESCQRHYAKIIMHLTDAKAPPFIKNKLETIDLEPVTEKLFDWLIDPKIKIAVKAFAVEALFNLRKRYDWVGDELASQIQYLMKDGTAAIQTKGRKLLKGLGST